ncbi:MAG: hypothetical protein IJO40_15710 [Thermoguttaceae bacterium]|nr:hypothetical protein [Thermoguttaceae bacterium]
MLYQCDKCGATTRWYDEKCPRCGAALTVEIPTIPIVLPNFASSPSRRDDATSSLTPDAKDEPARLETNEAKDETSRQQTSETPNEAARLETSETPNEAARLETSEAKDETARQETNEAKNETARQETNEAQNETARQETNEAKDETSPTKRSQLFLVFWRAVDAWRAAFAPETSSVTIPRGRAARYALGIVFELIVCPPCATLAAYFFTRAIFADRRAQYHSAIQETEKARRALVVGLGVFAAFLCAFMLYVRSHEARLPTETGPTSHFFKN